MVSSSVRRQGLVLATVLTVLAVGTACIADEPAESKPTTSRSSTGATGSASPGDPSSPPSAPQALAGVTVTPAEGASAVPPDEPVTVAASVGVLENVTVRDEDGDEVAGTFNPEKSQWTSLPQLKPGARYTVETAAKDADGKSVSGRSTFRTLTARSTLKASVSPLRGETVGVAMPIQIFWNRAVRDRVAVEKRLSVKTSVPVEGSWHWLNDKQVNYRPKVYWPAGTKVTVDIATQGVNAGGGVWGAASRSIDFAIGRSVVTAIDVKKHQMVVSIDGKPVRSIPITAGKARFVTRSGIKVIMEKYRTKRMDARTVGIQPGDPEYYNIRNVQYAQRVTYSGEFIHGAPWSGGSQGRDNVSHGCVGMSLKDGAWYFAQTRRGDPVIVTGTNRGMETGNGWTDWNDSWEKYKAGSALS